MSDIAAAELARIDNFPRLVELLRDHLDWPIDDDYGFEDVVFEYEAGELGLKPEQTAKVREIHQLRPLVTNQPWGVFFISFEDKSISVTVLRRILRALVVRKRTGAQSAERQAWDRNDLIFAANFGKPGKRELAFVYFSDGEATNDLPVMKVLGWNARDTRLHNEHVAYMLRDKLIWPDDPQDRKAWRGQWASAFELRLNETVRTSKGLAIRLAALATEIRARANDLLAAESDKGPMRLMLEAFRKNLIQDLDEDGFADMFAQTICYGMLAARISRPGAQLVADNMAVMAPKTNPFLKELFESFLKLGGRDRRKGMDFDELGVREVVDMLNMANMEAVLREFGNRSPKKDPVIHFYEDFLREYDKDQKVDAGIFYTPPAAVGFIVRGVDEMLRSEFGLPLGLADTTTWGELAARNDRIIVPEHIDPGEPFVQILDPATGTGTFLIEVIDLIHKRMMERWAAQGRSDAEIAEAWKAYVPKHLLPRITAFELKMAAYAIAHLKIGLKLAETGHEIGNDDRARVLLTNTLQPSRGLDLEERMRLEALTHEVERANDAKDRTSFTVVIGNPPYKGHSMNPSKVRGKLTFAGELIQRFFKVRGEPLNERNPKWLNNDYVKFIAFAIHRIERSGYGVLGYITSNSWLDSPTFRGMRTEIMDSFPVLRIVDLHGNIKKRETAPDGTRDEGVFAIEEGTNITIAGKLSAESADINVRQTDLLGSLGDGTGDTGKLSWLEQNGLKGVSKQIQPLPPIYQLTPMETSEGGENSLMAEFYAQTSLQNIQPLNNAGIVTANDALCVQFTKEEMEETVRQFLDIDLQPLLIERDKRGGAEKWKLDVSAHPVEVRLRNKKEPYDWQTQYAQDDLKSLDDWRGHIQPIAYRPFDLRSTLFTGKSRGFQCRPRPEVMRHMIGGGNVGLVTTRQRSQATGTWGNVFTANQLSESTSISNKTREINYLFPLWLKPTAGEAHRRPNIDRKFAQAFGKAVGLTYEDGIPRGQQASLGAEFRHKKPEQLSLKQAAWNGRGDLAKTFGPRDQFDWIYAVLHSPGYRTRYAEFLKSDFPRIPMPGNLDLFKALVPLGCELVALHLLKPDQAPVLKEPEIRFAGTGDARVEKGYPKYENGKAMINTLRWFEDVPEKTWEFHVGGYQVCEKWLKDRAARGGRKPSFRPRVLTEEDILHYRRIVVALTETRRLMAEIDNVIEEHGGWPGAFETGEG